MKFFDSKMRKEKWSDWRLSKVTAQEDSKLVTMPQHKYIQFAYNSERTFSHQQSLLCRLIPALSMRSKTKRQSVVNSFEEVALEKNCLLEVEGTAPKYLWLLLQGEMDVFKRPETLYDAEGKKTNCANLKLWQNPTDSGNQ